MNIKVMNKYSYELLKFLDLKNKPYNLDEIKKALLLKNIDSTNTDKHITLDKNGSSLFGFGNYPNKIRTQVLLSMIITNFIISNNKPEYDYYEYNQPPIHIMKKIDGFTS